MLVIWKERPIPFRMIRWGSIPVIGSPSNTTSPESGLSSPVMTLKSVDFPAPFGPMTARISPFATERETSWSARRPPNDFTTLRTSRRTICGCT